MNLHPAANPCVYGNRPGVRYTSPPTVLRDAIVRTAIIIAIGLALLGVFVIVGRVSGLGLARLVPWFVVLWMLVAGVNLWIGVARAGYSISEELPIFLIIFGIPAAAAIVLSRFLRA